MPQVQMRVATYWQMPDKTGTIRKTRLEKGKVYDVPQDVAERWVKRGIAAPPEEKGPEAKEEKKK